MSFAFDTFDRADASGLTTWTASDSGTWTAHSSWANSNVGFVSNLLQCGSTEFHDLGLFYHSADPAGADVTVEIDLAYQNTALGFNGVAARIQTSEDTSVYVLYDGVNEQWLLAEHVAGAETVLGAYGQVLSVGPPYHVKLECIGTVAKVYIDTVLRITGSEALAVTAAGKAGIFEQGDSWAVFNDFNASDVAGAEPGTGAFGVFRSSIIQGARS